MNERILAIMNEAQFHYPEIQSRGIEHKFEKFAELIIKECVGIAQDRAAFDWAPPNAVNHIISEIKEHFGVKE